jgi:hypothetical protein
LREEQLAERIKELGKRPLRVQQNQEQTSFWVTIKTPLLYLGGGLIVLVALGWIWSVFKDE